MDEILYFSSSCLFLNRSTPRFYSHSIGHTPSCTSSLSGRRHAGQVRIRSDSAASLTALEDAFLKIGLPSWKKIAQKGSVRVDRRGYNKSGNKRARFRASEPMPLLATADLRQTTCHPPRALPFGIIPTRPSCFYFHHPIPVCKVWNGFSSKPTSHCAGLAARTQSSGPKLWRFRGIYQQS